MLMRMIVTGKRQSRRYKKQRGHCYCNSLYGRKHVKMVPHESMLVNIVFRRLSPEFVGYSCMFRRRHKGVST